MLNHHRLNTCLFTEEEEEEEKEEEQISTVFWNALAFDFFLFFLVQFLTQSRQNHRNDLCFEESQRIWKGRMDG